ncbi:ABC transporter permease [Polynucleobacter sp. MWH-Mekk-B1]|uniref:ABC transporter permease n=1 Tax=Polynucleobacter finlandensis TaxID=1855894 RepID=UPI001C0C462B|nr:ABC transporter permease [Polynucleobacter finlandensis]MBU3545497.1 ABC transporter permease [Polynucleobacter finlandensis]
MIRFKSIWLYRDFILGSVKRDFQAKFQNSILGIFWTLLNPLAMILVYTVVFSQLMKARMPDAPGPYSYSIYLCMGILSWGLFSEVFNRSITLFLDNANLLKKIKLPKISFPIILVFNAWINFLIIFSLFVVFLILSKNFPGKIFLAVIPILLIISLFAIALGIGLGILNVFYRDIGQISGVFLQFWFWLTPIVYSIDILPPKLQVVLQLNPMVPLIAGLQRIVMVRQLPLWESLLYPLALAIVLSWWAMYLLNKHQNDMMDEL